MAKSKIAGNLTLELDEVSQEIDLSEYYEREPSSDEKIAFADLAIERINSRTLNGETINGGKFKRYTKKYADFKGVSRDSVDMFLEGDMLDSITRKKSYENKNSIYIGVKGDKQNKKVYNHNVGQTLPKRQFFGITQDEANSIAESVRDINLDRQERSLTISDLRAALNLLGLEQIE